MWAAGAAGAERVYVSDEKGGNVVIVDPHTSAVLARIPVGKRPRGIQVSPIVRACTMALTGSPMGGPNVDESKLPPPDRRYDGIGVVDLKAQKLITTYQSGADPETFALTHDGRTLYVSNEDSGELSAVDLAQGNVRTTVAVGSEPEGVAVSADDRLVYVACESRQQRLRIAGRGPEGAGADPHRQAPARDPAAAREPPGLCHERVRRFDHRVQYRGLQGPQYHRAGRPAERAADGDRLERR